MESRGGMLRGSSQCLDRSQNCTREAETTEPCISFTLPAAVLEAPPLRVGQFQSWRLCLRLTPGRHITAVANSHANIPTNGWFNCAIRPRFGQLTIQGHHWVGCAGDLITRIAAWHIRCGNVASHRPSALAATESHACIRYAIHLPIIIRQDCCPQSATLMSSQSRRHAPRLRCWLEA